MNVPRALPGILFQCFRGLYQKVMNEGWALCALLAVHLPACCMCVQSSLSNRTRQEFAHDMINTVFIL